MMNTIKSLLAAITLVVASCGFQQESEPQNTTELIIVVDITDPLPVYPQADAIWNLTGLDAAPYSGVKITLTTVSDLDIQPEIVVEIPAENRMNSTRKNRNYRIAQFRENLEKALQQYSAQDSTRRGHSIIFRSLIKHLNQLSESTATNRYCLLYSNLMENSEVNFYDVKTCKLLISEPDQVKEKLIGGTKMKDYAGIETYCIYQPYSYEENQVYMQIAELYKTIIHAHNGQVYVGYSP